MIKIIEYTLTRNQVFAKNKPKPKINCNLSIFANKCIKKRHQVVLKKKDVNHCPYLKILN